MYLFDNVNKIKNAIAGGWGDDGILRILTGHKSPHEIHLWEEKLMSSNKEDRHWLTSEKAKFVLFNGIQNPYGLFNANILLICKCLIVIISIIHPKCIKVVFIADFGLFLHHIGSDRNPGMTLGEPSRLLDRDVLRSCLYQNKKKKFF